MRLTADLWVKTFSYLESDLPSLSSPNEIGVLAYYVANALPISNFDCNACHSLFFLGHA